MSRSPKDDDFVQHLTQDIQQLDLSQVQLIRCSLCITCAFHVIILKVQLKIISRHVDSVQPIVKALKDHPIQRIIVVSSTRVYGESHGERIDDDL